MNRADKILDNYRAAFDARMPMFDRTYLYGNLIQLFGAEQFTWKHTPETINSHWIERSVNTGLSVAYEVPENISAVCKGFTVTPAAFIGVPDQKGETSKVITTGSDYSLQIDLKKDKAVIIKNNDYMYSEYINLLWFAEMLARTDESEKALIIWSKMHPIGKAQTGIEGEKLKEVIRGIIERDDLFGIIDDNSKIINGTPTSRDDNVLRLTDENAVEKMHFLSEFHYELIRRYCTLYNMPFRTNSKSAQSLESELHNTDIFSKVINANRLKCRQEAAERINNVFGLNMTVDFSDLIKQENEVIESNIKQEINEAENENVSRETIDETETTEETESDNDGSENDNNTD